MIENAPTKELGELIMNLLFEKKLSMRKLSLICEIDPSTISRIVSCKQTPTIMHLQKLANALELPLDQAFISAGYKLQSNTKITNNNVEILINAIDEILKQCNLLNKENLCMLIENELNKYEQYALTQEGKELIIKNLPEKIMKTNGMSPFIDQLTRLYNEFCNDENDEKHKAILLSGLLYFILSTDIIPDYIFPIGYLDDFIAIKIVEERLSKRMLLNEGENIIKSGCLSQKLNYK